MGYEKLANALLPGLAGANVISGVGFLDEGLCASYEQLVLDDEMIATIYRILRGIEVSEETLALDVIERAMDGDSFMEQEHTLRHLRTGEVMVPALSDRSTFEEWRARGNRDLGEVARARVREILRDHEVEPLSKEVEREIEGILTEAEAELGAG